MKKEDAPLRKPSQALDLNLIYQDINELLPRYVLPDKRKEFKQELIRIITERVEQSFVGKRLLSLAEASRFLGRKPKTIYNQLSEERFPIRAKRVGGRVMFDIRDLQKFVDEL